MANESNKDDGSPAPLMGGPVKKHAGGRVRKLNKWGFYWGDKPADMNPTHKKAWDAYMQHVYKNKKDKQGKEVLPGGVGTYTAAKNLQRAVRERIVETRGDIGEVELWATILLKALGVKGK